MLELCFEPQVLFFKLEQLCFREGRARDKDRDEARQGEDERRHGAAGGSGRDAVGGRPPGALLNQEHGVSLRGENTQTLLMAKKMH